MGLLTELSYVKLKEELYQISEDEQVLGIAEIESEIFVPSTVINDNMIPSPFIPTRREYPQYETFTERLHNRIK